MSDSDPQSQGSAYKYKKRSYDSRDDSSDEEEQVPAKRQRSSILRASSQSSSGAEYASTSDHQSQPESDGEAPPSFGNSHYNATLNAVEPSKSKYKVGNIGELLMKKAGFVEGRGLGKHGQGTIEPIQASKQRGRTGLGFTAYSKGEGYQGPSFDPSMESISAEEKVEWMVPSEDAELDRDTLEDWMETGPRKMTIHDEVEFCDESILQDVLSLKTNLDEMTSEDLRRVRSLCNPYEKIGSAFFINRAALKMANMDAVFDFMFTNPKDANGHPIVGEKELIYFADVCAGPGGFTEYVLWKKKWLARGFGFTLKSSNDFKLGDLNACSTETFTPYYGANDDGDVFNPDNLEALKKFVLTNTDGKGVHFMMADGGFSVEGQENIQEVLSKQLYLCQCIAALSIVRVGGNFLVKLFDVFTEFSVGLVYLMYRSFDKVCIHKPNTSRPANSERYLICFGKRESCDSIERHLFYVNQILWQYNKKVDKDVTHLVPLNVIKDDENFFKYICDSNNKIGELQKVNLLKVIECYKNPSKYEETRHAEMRTACLKLWMVPDLPKSHNQPGGQMKAIESLLAVINSNKITLNERGLMDILKFRPKQYRSSEDKPVLSKILSHKFDWKFVFLNSLSSETTGNKFSFFLGSTGCYTLELVGGVWRRNEKIRLPLNTLVLAESVQENSREGNAMKRHSGFHIIDAFLLGGVCIVHKTLEERYNMIALFCKAHNKPQLINLENPPIPLRCKKLFDFKDFQQEMANLVKRQVKIMGKVNTTSVPNLYDNSDLYYVTRSVLFIKETKEPWARVYSATQNNTYYFNEGNNTYKLSDITSPELSMNTFETIKRYIEWYSIHDTSVSTEDPFYQTVAECSILK